MNPVVATTASTGTASALVTIIVWLFGLYHVTVPTEVAGALVMAIAAGGHWIAQYLTKPAAPAPVPLAPLPVPAAP